MCDTCKTTCNCQFKITKAGEYKNRRGFRATVIGFRPDNGRAIGYVLMDGNKGSASWDIDGKAGGYYTILNGINQVVEAARESDIVAEWKEPLVKEVWFNIYKESTLNQYPRATKSRAEEAINGSIGPLDTFGVRWTEGKGAEIIRY